ncbi:hypothetical protein GCM10010270_61930 [Streptomyces violaceus]|nr:hypothetical protein GCM10010270_61930 [Streptomyces janthinus]
MGPHLLAGLALSSSGTRGCTEYAAPPRARQDPTGPQPTHDQAAGHTLEYPYSGATTTPRPTMEGMLWSDPENEPPKELRDMQDMLRRLGVLMALAMVVAMLVIGVR